MGVTQYTFSAEQWERVSMSRAVTRTMNDKAEPSCGMTAEKTRFIERVLLLFSELLV